MALTTKLTEFLVLNIRLTNILLKLCSLQLPLVYEMFIQAYSQGFSFRCALDALLKHELKLDKFNDYTAFQCHKIPRNATQ